MIFGKDRDKGRRLDGMKLKVVKLGENGITEKDLLVHDAHQENPGLHSMLIDMQYPGYPVALGVIRAVKDTTYDDNVRDQITEVRSKSPIQCMDDLLVSGATWEVE